MTSLPIVITTGEPAGIGPDITLMAALREYDFPIIALGDVSLLKKRAEKLKIAIQFEDYFPGNIVPPHQAGRLWVWHIPLQAPVQVGLSDPHNAKYVLEILQKGMQECLDGRAQALVTAPINKKIINQAGIPFSGHTEYLAEFSHTRKTVMLLMTEQMKVALLTTHIPLSEVSQAVTADALEDCIQIIHQDLQKRFRIKEPKILVCGLNPHAGEGGYIGQEEQEIMIPALKKLQQSGFAISGPVSADTAFLPQNLAKWDVILAMYHDQGLPVLKYQGFGHAVNVTLGLPFVRTSVDHGTAEDIAGTGFADPGSLIQAIVLAAELCQ